MAKATTSLNLQQSYRQEVRPALMKSLGVSNPHQLPQLNKVIVSVGLGRSKEDKRAFEAATTTLRKITGQQPIELRAKSSIASFKLREGQPIGLKVTLRDQRMYEFVERLIHVVLPRVRDFHGVSSKSFDKSGHYSLGFEDQSVWPELSFEDTAYAHGLQVTFVIKAESVEHAKALLAGLGLPFSKEGDK